MRRLIHLVIAMVAAIGLTVSVAGAQTVSPSAESSGPSSQAEAARAPYAISLGRVGPDRWHVVGEGRVTFYDRTRQFRLAGNHNYHHTDSDSARGYPQVKQNIANTSVDGAWVSFEEDGCDVDRSGPGTDFACELLASTHYFSSTTQPGRGLAGVWLRFCKTQSGPDLCGRDSQVDYVDNPFL